MKLFISYSRDDTAWTIELQNALNDKLHHQVWMDRQIIPGADWWESILDEIENCDCLVYVMTPNSIDSVFCQAEWQYALDLNKPILPVLLKKCEFPKLLSDRQIQYLDVASKYESITDILLKMERAFSFMQDSIKKADFKPYVAKRPKRPIVEISKNIDTNTPNIPSSENDKELKPISETNYSEGNQFEITRILELVNSPIPANRKNAIIQLAKTKHFYQTIINALCDEERNVRQTAIDILLQHQNDNIYDELSAILKGERETRFRENLDVSRINALLILQSYPYQAKYGELLKISLFDHDPDIRLQAIIAAARTNNLIFWNSFIELLDDPSDGWVRLRRYGGIDYRPVNIVAGLALLHLNWHKAKSYLETHTNGKFIENLNIERHWLPGFRGTFLNDSY
jgi:hypothetical protein